MFKSSIMSLSLLALLALSSVAPGQTVDEVGDVASFGKEAKFFGFAQTGGIIVSRDCTTLPFPLGPDDRCFTLNGNNATSFDVKNIGRIKFPASTFENIIYLLTRHQVAFNFLNATTTNKTGRLVYRPYITLVSSRLEDPSLINPMTGLPFNGQMDISQAGGRTLTKTLFPNYQENDFLTYGSPSISGITKKYLMDNYNLPQNVVDDIFQKEITIRLNIAGQTSNIEQGSFNWGVRFIGN